MLKAVVFDMDETLLSINLGTFIAMYARDVARLLADIGRKNPLAMFASLTGTFYALNANVREPDDTQTNIEFFHDEIRRRCGIPLDDPIIADAFDCYERTVLPNCNDSLIAARPLEGAHEAIDAVLARGLRVALFTNPSFTRACIECRMGWGELLDVPFELVTSMENSTRCKPDMQYYRESVAALGLEPHEVLMVGNDPKRDLPDPECSIQTAYVGRGTPAHAIWCGSMADFASSFNEIEERFYERQEHDAPERTEDASAAQRS